MKLKSNSAILVGLLLTLSLLWPAIYNGSPLYFTFDTFSYLHKQNAQFRPNLLYGTFTEFASMGISLWWILFFQTAIVVSLLLWVLSEYRVPRRIWVASFLVAVTASTLPIFASLILPDIFGPIAFLCFLLLAGRPEKKKLMLYPLFLFSLFSHLSHLIIFPTLYLVSLSFSGLYSGKNTKRVLGFFCLTLPLSSLSPYIGVVTYIKDT